MSEEGQPTAVCGQDAGSARAERSTAAPGGGHPYVRNLNADGAQPDSGVDDEDVAMMFTCILL
jgi:hypothetical protein